MPILTANMGIMYMNIGITDSWCIAHTCIYIFFLPE